MLRNRSRAVGGKQGLMSDSQPFPSPTGNSLSKPTASSLFPSPRLFRSFSSKGFADSEVAMSPTSILETRHLSSFGNVLYSDKQPKKPPCEVVSASTESKHHSRNYGRPEPIGLGLVDALNDDKAKESSKAERRMVVSGSQLRIQIPSINSNSNSLGRSMELPSSPIEFGIKNKDSQLALFSPIRRSLGHHHEVSVSSPRVFTGSISASEMELSEDYTCVISHGPNPKTTHIFDNCIVESCGEEFMPARKDNSFVPSQGYPADDFITFCYACKKILGHGKDIFMYRGEKAFCSNECRYHEMLIYEELDNHSTDSSLKSSPSFSSSHSCTMQVMRKSQTSTMEHM
ncbi:unnamed protein product [Musa acuminata subsp. malaccensis]|uniref:(wild Malaysian banana) hypothetical protein n=1 Tax=Musa acuminata subsp. malaccensis TaxID=214687 RepID=A0A804KNV1_MUSAM|nr:PREDICTED: protein MARD1 [Musa acuminata subsp. malaccensis]XP_009418944.1 PREDICTED: protein MARD1 [Musa acuminata subsp. malaccensis]CAG1836514.1 unnamed protein product [Musa acuminata subsp. malaccensis]